MDDQSKCVFQGHLIEDIKMKDDALERFHCGISLCQVLILTLLSHDLPHPWKKKKPSQVEERIIEKWSRRDLK